MAIDPKYYIHESDKAALDALEAIPGFTPFARAFMKGWNEKQFRILNMSSRIRIDEEQLPAYHRMLTEVAEKLCIKVPELYLELNVVPNAYTYGDNDPFIVITSGLIDTMPEPLIRTVLAHECGHIACHHTLYRTMGQMILSGTALLPGVGALVSLPLKIAFAGWMRQSELSADRAAVLIEGSADPVVELCMRFAGYTRHITEPAQKEHFLKQALEYKDLIKDGTLSQTMEFLMLAGQSHPLIAIRAYEAQQWGTSDYVQHLLNYLKEEEQGAAHTEVPFTHANDLTGMNAEDAIALLGRDGFTNLRTEREITVEPSVMPGSVISVSVCGQPAPADGTWCKPDDPIVLTCYEPLTPEEEAKLHPGEVRMPDSSLGYYGRGYTEVCRELLAAGFKNIFTISSKESRPFFFRDDGVCRITVGDRDQFEKGEWFTPDIRIRVYHF